MEESRAIAPLGALGHGSRLTVFRMLIREAPDGVSAGDIAARLGVAPSSLSFHLAVLERAGLIASRRDRRRVIYSADIDGTREILAYLTEDCCGGRPEICAGLPGAGRSKAGQASDG